MDISRDGARADWHHKPSRVDCQGKPRTYNVIEKTRIRAVSDQLVTLCVSNIGRARRRDEEKGERADLVGGVGPLLPRKHEQEFWRARHCAEGIGGGV